MHFIVLPLTFVVPTILVVEFSLSASHSIDLLSFISRTCLILFDHILDLSLVWTLRSFWCLLVYLNNGRVILILICWTGRSSLLTIVVWIQMIDLEVILLILINFRGFVVSYRFSWGLVCFEWKKCFGVSLYIAVYSWLFFALRANARRLYLRYYLNRLNDFLRTLYNSLWFFRRSHLLLFFWNFPFVNWRFCLLIFYRLICFLLSLC